MFRQLQRCLLSLSLSLCRFSGHWSLKYRKSLLLPLHFRTISTIIVSNCLRSSQVVLFIFSCLYETLRNIPTLDAILVCFEGILIVTKGGFCFPPPSVPHEWGSKKKSPGAWWICEMRQRWKAVNCKFVFRSLQTRSFRLRNPRNPDPEDFNKPSFNPT